MPNVEDVPIPNQAAAAAPSDAQSLARLAEIADRLGEDSVAGEIQQLVTRIHEGRFFVACVGQFKRGKSTLLDALVGEPILPTGVVPVTAVPTVLRHGATRGARVLIDGKWQAIEPEELPGYVSEELNPENSKQVAGVEVFLPSPLLGSGMCLVDTPGIGSVFSGNTETTRQFVPKIDAAILVIGADPPISGEELALIKAVAANVDHILIVLNKIDRVSATERQEASAFARRVLEARLGQPVDFIYEVSALNRLSHTADAGDWNKLMGDLAQLANQSGEAMTRSAAQRGIRRFSGSLRRAIDEQVRALEAPIASSEQRVANLHQTVSQAEQSLRDLGTLFSAEQMRLSVTLLARRKEFLKQTFPVALAEFERESRCLKTRFGPARRRQLMALAQTVAWHYVNPWLDTEEAQTEELYKAVTQRFVNMVNGLLQRIAEEQAADFSHLPKSMDAEHGFRIRSLFFFQDFISIAQPASPLRYVADVVMGTLHVRRWFRRDAEHFLQLLLDTNASRVQGDVEQRVVESRLRLESDLRKLLRELTESAEHALANARELVAVGQTAVQSGLGRMAALKREIETATSALTGGEKPDCLPVD